MEERLEDETRMGRLTDTELFHLHVLIEQAAHEIRQHRPQVHKYYAANIKQHLYQISYLFTSYPIMCTC